ncbi:MAG: hypothetical protein FWH37_09825, partial [Candidatus Bathyarchaeota archaeon]|nr:hypothetical protein [Candidatus Termiticorpusculum sp.]
MKNTKNNLNTKSFRRGKFAPIAALLLVVMLFSSPFLSIAWGGETYNIVYTFEMGGDHPAGGN